jgi:hypothetical protein
MKEYDDCMSVNREIVFNQKYRGGRNFASTMLVGEKNTSHLLLPKLEDTLRLIIPWTNAGSFSWKMRRFIKFTNLQNLTLANNDIFNSNNEEYVDMMCNLITNRVLDGGNSLNMDCDNLFWLCDNQASNYNYDDFKVRFENEVSYILRSLSGFR